MGERLRNLRHKRIVVGLLVLVVGGCFVGWRCLAKLKQAQASIMLPDDYQAVEALQVCPGLDEAMGLLDAGQYRDAADYLDALEGEAADHPTVLRYKAIAQFAAGRGRDARKTADAALAAGATGADATIALSLKALTALSRPEIARPLAEQAVAGGASVTSQAGLIANVAYAAAVRAEHDLSPGLMVATELGELTEEALNLFFFSVPGEPSSAWQSRFWRHGLALLADSRMLAGEAGDAEGELAAMELLQQSCPDDAWNCYFGIPDRARLAAQQGWEVDDHARVAMLTAVGFMYITSFDRFHGDMAFRKAIVVYGRVLEDYDGWYGQIKRTVTPLGQFKNVGEEFYTYSNRMQRLAKYCGGWWGIRAVRGQASLDEALAKSDDGVFRAMVRFRADQEADPVQILREEQLPPLYYATVAYRFLTLPYPPQADWEADRAALLDRIGHEEVQAGETIRSARQFMRLGRYEEALSLLDSVLVTEPSLAETGTSLRCEVAFVLMKLERYDEARSTLSAADQVLAAGDEHPPFGQDGLWARIGYYHMLIARRTGSVPEAIQLAELLIDDERVQPSLRARTLLDLIQMHAERSDKVEALNAYERLAGLSVTPAESESFLQPILSAAESRLSQKGWLDVSPLAM